MCVNAYQTHPPFKNYQNIHFQNRYVHIGHPNQLYGVTILQIQSPVEISVPSKLEKGKYHNGSPSIN